MAGMVSQIDNKSLVGRQVFDIITSGMYDNPLMAIREYVQNSSDAIDSAVRFGLISIDNSLISITLTGNNRSIVIEDNGAGVHSDAASHSLRSIGLSAKESNNSRGFRGIGRLGGLAYCEELLFETKAPNEEVVSIIKWSHPQQLSHGSYLSLDEVISLYSTIKCRPAHLNDPKHFFRVTLSGVKRFHADVLMNIKNISSYLSQVAPVAHPNRFTFSKQITENLSDIEDFTAYNIKINNTPIFRPYNNEIPVTSKTFDKVTGIEYFTFKNQSEAIIAKGWYALTSFKGAILPTSNLSGIRIRQGNIEVGDGRFLDSFFTEKRFSSWVAGEIHIINNALTPNARRDGFEQSADYESFLESATRLCRHLSNTCRQGSKYRKLQSDSINSLKRIESLFYPSAVFIDEQHFSLAVADAKETFSGIKYSNTKKFSAELNELYNRVADLLNDSGHTPLYLTNLLDGRKLRGIDQKRFILKLCQIIVDSYPSSTSPLDLLRNISDEFTLSKIEYFFNSHQKQS